MGYGNGTLHGSPSLIVTLGYGVGGAIVTIAGPCVVTAEAYIPGCQRAEAYIPGCMAADTAC
jgi:hypothetical protein